MIVKENYSNKNIDKLVKYFNNSEQSIERSLIEQHLYCLGLLESFSKIGMNFVLSGDMAVYLMTDKNLYLPNSLEIRVNRQDYLYDYLKEASSVFESLSYQMIKEENNYVVFEYQFLSLNNQIVKIYLNVILEAHITNNVMSVAIDKPYIINEERIYRIKTPIYEELYAYQLFYFKPNYFKGKVIDTDDFSLFLIKRVADMDMLYPYLENFYMVIYYYHKIFSEYKKLYEDLNYDYLIYDAFNSLVNIYCQGRYRPEYYLPLRKGIIEIQKYSINEMLDLKNIFKIAAYPLFSCACLYQCVDCVTEEIVNHKKMRFYNYSKINMMKKLDYEYFNVVYQAIEIYERLDIIEKA